MSAARLDELTAALADGGLSPEDRAELERLLEGAGADARERARAFLELEAGLQRLRPTPDVSAAVMDALGAHDSAAVDRVMRDVQRGAPAAQAHWRARAEARRSSRRARWAAVALALGGAAAFASVALWRRAATRSTPEVGPDAKATGSAGSRHPRSSAAVRRRVPELARGTAAPPEVAPAGAPGAVVLFSYDFEDGGVPPALGAAAVTPGPPRSGNRYVAAGGLSRWAPQSNLAELDLYRGGHVLSWNPNVVVSFDYWAGADTQGIRVLLFSPKRQKNFFLRFEGILRERWAHATVRLAELAAIDGSNVRPEPGEALTTVVIVGGKLPGGGLFVDNIRAVEYREAAPVPRTGITPLETGAN